MLQTLLNCPSSLTKDLLLIITSTIFLVFVSFGQAPLQITDLVPNQPLEPGIKGGETHIFQVHLKKGETSRIEVVQNGIDVVVSLFAPDGKPIVVMDGKNGQLWREVVTAIAKEEGIYRIEVKAYGVAGLVKNYQIKLFELRKTETKDLKIQQAEKAISEGRKFYDQSRVTVGEPAAENKLIDEAIKQFDLAVKLWREIGDREWEAISLTNLAWSSQLIRKYPQTIEAHSLAIPIYQETKDRLGEGKALNGIGNCFSLQGENEKAIEYYEKTLMIRRELNDKRGEAGTLVNVGTVYGKLFQDEKAAEYFKKALALRREIKDLVGLGQVLSQLGAIYHRLDQLAEAKKYYEEALHFEKQFNNPTVLGDILNLLGLLSSQLGLTDQAIKYFEEALKLTTEINNDFLELRVLNNLGLIYYGQKKYEEAKTYLERALKVGDKIRESIKDYTLTILGRVYFELGQPQLAIETLEKAITLNKITRSDVIKAMAFQGLGEINLRLKQIKKARDSYQTALSISRGGKNLMIDAISLKGLMDIGMAEKQPELAIFYGKQLVNTVQKLRSNLKGLEQNLQDLFVQNRAAHYRQLADLLIAEGRFREAQQVLEMLKESEYFEFVRRDKSEIEKLSKRVDLTDKEKLVLENYLKFSEKVTLLGQELETLEEKKAKLKTGETLSPIEQARLLELQTQLKTANEAFQLFLDKELVARLSTEKAKGIEYDQSLQNDLKRWGNGTVSVYTVLANDRYRAIVTTAYSQTDGKTEISLTELNKKIFTFREALMNPKSDPRPLAKELYELLIKPIEKDLQGAQAKTIIWSLDGSLRYIPIAALWDGNQYLVEKYQNIALTSATRQSLKENSDPEWKALAGGVSLGHEIQLPLSAEKMFFKPLPKVSQELTEIVRNEEIEQPSGGRQSGILSGRVLLNQEFSEKNLTASLQKVESRGKKKYNLLHVASHFRLGSNISNSFLLLGGGRYVTLEQIKTLPEFDLSGVELVTLSACNTGFNGGGSGAEIDSLATLLEGRGAKASLSSLWEVADESTYRLMVEFYRRRKADPTISKAEALREAQVKLLRDKTNKYKHPYFWSSFLLVGNWQ